MVDASTHRWEPLVGNYLPDDLAPQTFDDVKMCVVIEWARKAVGEYQVTGTDSQGRPTNRGTQVAVAQNCHVTLVDLTTHAVIAENDFEGRVAERIRSDTPDIGDNAKPIEELEAWLFKLPRKP